MSLRPSVALWSFASVLIASQALSAPCHAESDPCRASSEREAWVQRRFDAEVKSGASGARLSVTRVSGSDNNDTGNGLGLTLSGHSERYGAYQLFTIREASFGFIGGGSLGFEGGVGGNLAAGLRLPAGSNHGPFFRLGIRGYLLGNDKLYESLLEAPQLQLGYQVLRPGEVFELAGRVGPVLAGRFNTGDDAERKLGKSFEVGGHLGLHSDPLHLEVEHTHVLANGTLSDVDLFSGRFCGDAWLLQLCVDGRVGRGDAVVPGQGPLADNPVTSLYGGMSLGILEGVLQPEPPRGHKR